MTPQEIIDKRKQLKDAWDDAPLLPSIEIVSKHSRSGQSWSHRFRFVEDKGEPFLEVLVPGDLHLSMAGVRELRDFSTRVLNGRARYGEGETP